MSGRLGLFLLLSLVSDVSSSDKELSLWLFLKLSVALSGPLSLASTAVAKATASRVATAANQRDGEVVVNARS